jgi:hypothetical protein
MKEMKLQKKFRMIVVSAAMALSVAAVHAQDQTGDTRSVNPIPPISSTDSGADSGSGKRPIPAAHGVFTPYADQAYDPSQVEPDTNTLSGAEVFGVGSLQHSRDVFDPFLSVTALGQSGIVGTTGQTGLHATTLVGGGLNFNQIWSRYHFTATYTGGETLYYGFQPNTMFHNLAVSQDIEWRRWRVHLRDNFVASPGAVFTGSGMGGPGLIGEFSSTLANSLNTVGQSFQPSETIQTGQAMRYMNAVVGEAEYSFSRRSAFTVSGSYGLLHFTDPGYIDSHMFNAQAGYDYLLDPKNSVAVLASYGKIDYTETSNSTVDYLADLAFGRKITGRLAFQAAAGPQQIRVTSAAIGNFQLWTWSANTALTYERRRSGISVAFVRGLTGGSGVFFGARSNTFSGSLHHQFTRFWSASVIGGYALNTSLAPTGAATSSFNTWLLGANVGRQLGRHAQVGFNYGLLKQVNPAVCPVTSCGVAGFQQSFGMTVNWHLFPILE